MKDMVDILYATAPGERLGLVRPILEEEFIHLNGPMIEKLENTALRIVAWMCEQDSYERNGYRKEGR
jgi:hypothetical protein